MVMGFHRRLLQAHVLMLHELLMQQKEQLKQQQGLQQPCQRQVIDVLLLMLLLLILIDVLLLKWCTFARSTSRVRLHLARLDATRPSGAHSTGDRTGADGETHAPMPIRSTIGEGVKMMNG